MIPSLSPVLVVTKLSPFDDGCINHREFIYAESKDDALVEALTDILPRWEAVVYLWSVVDVG